MTAPAEGLDRPTPEVSALAELYRSKPLEMAATTEIWDLAARLEQKLAEAEERAKEQGRNACEIFDECKRAQSEAHNLRAERDRLREALERSPHDQTCGSQSYAMSACDCHKAALAKEDKYE